MRDKTQTRQNLSVLLLLAALVCGSSSAGAAQISRITVDSFKKANYIWASAVGGIRIQFHGINFDVDNFDNRVMIVSPNNSEIDPFECIMINFFTTEKLLVCEIPFGEYVQYSYYQPELRVRGKVVECPVSKCRIQLYNLGSLPITNFVSPKVLSPGDKVSILGYFQNFYFSEKVLKIDDKNCVIKHDQLSYYDYFLYNYEKLYRFVECTVPDNMEMGNFKFKTKDSHAKGYSINQINSFAYDESKNWESYQFQVRPQISKISASKTLKTGQVIEIEGVGFGHDISKLKIQLDHQVECRVIRAEGSKVTCILDSFTQDFSDKIYKGSAGLIREWRGYFVEGLEEDYVTKPYTILSRNDLMLNGEALEKYDTLFRATGVFRTRAAGTYNFKLSSNLLGYFFLSKAPLDFTKPVSEIEYEKILSTKSSNIREYSVKPDQMTDIDLEADSDYYIALFLRNYSTYFNFSLSMVTPTFDQNSPLFEKKVQEIRIVNEAVFYSWEITIQNMEGGFFSMIFVREDPDSDELLYFKETKPMDFETSPQTMASLIYWAVRNNSEVEKTLLDANGNPVLDVEDAKGIKIQINYTSYGAYSDIEPYIKTDDLEGENITVEVVQLSSQSDRIYGHFYLKYGDDVSTHIYSSEGANIFENKLQNSVSALKGGVRISEKGIPNNGKTWYIEVLGVENPLDFEIHQNHLKGGNNDQGKPEIAINTNYKPATEKMVFNPIPVQFLTTLHESPQLTMTHDGTRVLCKQNICDLDPLLDSETPSVVGSSFSDPVLNLEIQIPASLDLTSEEQPSDQTVEVFIGQVPCESVVVNLPNIACQVPKNPDGTHRLEAGEYFPRVHLKGFGFFENGNSISKFIVPLSVTSLTPNQGSKGGGAVVQIEGTGFGFINELSTPNVTIDGQDCELLSFSNQLISCIIPPQSNPSAGDSPVDLIVSQNGIVSSSSTFTYKDSLTPEITSLSKSSASPILETSLIISGVNFGTNLAETTAVLVNPQDSEDSLICAITDLQDTSLSCTISGGRKGEYLVVIQRETLGASVPSNIGSNLITFSVNIDSIWPTQGSSQGGTILTIDGSNFSEDETDHQVYFGENQLNSCTVLTSSSSQITCRIDPLSDSITSTNVSLVLRGSKVADCASCDFTFTDASNTPKINSLSILTGKEGDQVTVAGVNFPANQDPLELALAEFIVAGAVWLNDTQVRFSIPSIQAGQYPMKIKFGNFGFSDKNASFTELTIRPNIDSFSPTSGSQFGEILTISGSGFTEKSKIKLQDKECKITQVSLTSITCISPSVSGVAGIPLVLSHESFEKSYTSLSYTPSAVSPQVSSISQNLANDLSSLTLTLEGTYIKEDTNSPSNPYNQSDITAQLVPKNNELLASQSISGTTSFSGNSVVISFTNIVAGVYDLTYHIQNVGLAEIPSSGKNLELNPQVSTIPQIQSSWLGGACLKIFGSGFPEGIENSPVSVSVCNKECTQTFSSFNEIRCDTPFLQSIDLHNYIFTETPYLLTDYTITADNPDVDVANLFDNDVFTYYQGKQNTECWFELDFGEHKLIRATQINFLPLISKDHLLLVGGVFEASLDKVNYSTLVSIDEHASIDWNMYQASDDSWKFRYLRYKGPPNGCFISEVEIIGNVFSDLEIPNLAAQSCDVKINVLDSEFEVVQNNKVVFLAMNTGKIHKILPNKGPISGNTRITILGENFANDNLIKIDGIECAIESQSSTSVTCLTGPKTGRSAPSLEMYSPTKGRVDTDGNLFYYFRRWSDSSTWSGVPPKVGDLVRVPEGTTILVDQSTPVLGDVVVEGVLIWADEQDLTFDAENIIVKKGRVLIGTEDSPHQHRLELTLHGDKESFGKSVYGVKGIYVQKGQFKVYGNPLERTKTFLMSSVSPGESTVNLMHFVDWQVGDEVIIGSTSRNPTEGERRVITQINGNNLTLDRPLEFKHFGGFLDPEDPTGRDGPVSFGAEIGLLTRNIKIQGDQKSKDEEFGVSLYFTQETTEVNLSFIEIRYAGQTVEPFRSSIHFHGVTFSPGHSIEDCSIYSSFARGINVNSTSLISLKNNIFYDIQGHNISILDGVEKFIEITDNFFFNVRKSSKLENLDYEPAAIFLKTPEPTVQRNHISGSEGHGIWINLSDHSSGLSVSSHLCPKGYPLGLFEDNKAHGCQIGLYISPKFVPLEYPCQDFKDETKRDPFTTNKPIPATFSQTHVYMNEVGIWGHYLGAVVFKNSVVVSNRVGVHVQRPNQTRDSLMRLDDSVILGHSALLDLHFDPSTQETREVLEFSIRTGNFSGFWIYDVRFYNIEQFAFVCYMCKERFSRSFGGARTTFEKIRIENSPSLKLTYEYYYHVNYDVLYDRDGSLIRYFGLESEALQKFSKGAWIVSYNPASLKIKECDVFRINDIRRELYVENTSQAAYFTVCSTDTSIMTLQTFKKSELYYMSHNIVTNLSSTDWSPDLGRNWGHSSLFYIINDIMDGISFGYRGHLLLATGYTYNLNDYYNTDLDEITFQNDYLWDSEPTKRPIYLQFNHTSHRELFDGQFTGVDSDEEYRVDYDLSSVVPRTRDGELVSLEDSNRFGDYYYNLFQDKAVLKIDGSRIGKVKLTAIYCRWMCPIPPEEQGKTEKIKRFWSIMACWDEMGKLPEDDEVIVIKKHWNMHLDVHTPRLKKLQVYGKLIFDKEKSDLQINSENIEIMDGGEIQVGSNDEPFEGKAVINLHGNTGSESMTSGEAISPVQNAILNKGKLSMFGQEVAHPWLRLTRKVVKGDSVIRVSNPNHGWKNGDELVIASTSTQSNHREKVTILEVDGATGDITLANKLRFFHYGAEDILKTEHGDLDMRAEVGNLTRNVVIQSEEQDFGCSVLTSEQLNPDESQKRSDTVLTLKSIEMRNFGKIGLDQAGVSFADLPEQSLPQTVSNSSFNEGLGWALSTNDSENVNFSKNVIFNAKDRGFVFTQTKKSIVTENLLVGIRRDESYAVGVLYNDTTSLKSNEFYLQNNSVSSSDFLAFAVPGYTCGDDDSDPSLLQFYGNSGHSSEAGWFPTNLDDSSCNVFANFRGYKNNELGLAHQVSVNESRVKNMVLADNRTGAAINSSLRDGESLPSVSVSESVFIGKALSDCPECYEEATECSTSGIYTSLFNGEGLEMDAGQDSIPSPLHNSTSSIFEFGGTQSIKNVIFRNFNSKDTCGSPSPAIKLNEFYQDKTIAVFVEEVELDSVDQVFSFPESSRHQNALAFCGKHDCTGLYNIPIYDVDGSLGSEALTYFANNDEAASNNECTFMEEENGYACKPLLAQLVMKQKREGAPVAGLFPATVRIDGYLSSVPQSEHFVNVVNSEFEVVSFAKTSKTNEITFNDSLPDQMKFNLLTKSEDEWAIFTVVSEEAETMTVYTNDGKTHAFPHVFMPYQPVNLAQSSSRCGFNYYDINEKKMHFVLNGKKDCNVTVKFAHAMEMKFTYFGYKSNDFELYRVLHNNLVTYLNVPFKRIKIVDSKVDGDLVVTVHVESDLEYPDQKEDSVEDFRQMMENFEEAVNQGLVNFGLPLKKYECPYKPVVESSGNEDTPSDPSKPVIVVIDDNLGNDEDANQDPIETGEVDHQEEDMQPIKGDPVEQPKPPVETPVEETPEEAPEEEETPEEPSKPAEDPEEDTYIPPIVNPVDPETSDGVDETPEPKPVQPNPPQQNEETPHEKEDTPDTNYLMLGVIIASFALVVVMLIICCCCCCRRSQPNAANNLSSMSSISLNQTGSLGVMSMNQPQYVVQQPQPLVISKPMNVIQQPRVIRRTITAIPQTPGIQYV